jgi:AbrB family looped-hinge helix DNA binding protein
VLVSKITSQGQITIPREIREKLKVEAGDFLAFDITADGVKMRRVAPFDRGWHAALAGTLDEWWSPQDREDWRHLLFLRYPEIMRTKFKLEGGTPGAAKGLGKQSPASTAPLRVRNGVPLFVAKPRASKPGLRIVNQLWEDV